MTMNPALDIATAPKSSCRRENALQRSALEPGAAVASMSPGWPGPSGASVVALFPQAAPVVMSSRHAGGYRHLGARDPRSPVSPGRASRSTNSAPSASIASYCLADPDGRRTTECLNQLREVAASADFVVARRKISRRRLAGVSTGSPMCAQLDAPWLSTPSGGGLQHLTGGNVTCSSPVSGSSVSASAASWAARRNRWRRPENSSSGEAHATSWCRWAPQGALLVTADGAQRYRRSRCLRRRGGRRHGPPT